MTDTLREAFRSLQLPILPERENDCLVAIEHLFIKKSYDAEEHLPLLRLSVQEWREEEIANDLLQEIVPLALRLGHDDFGVDLAGHYFFLHKALKQNHLFSHAQATAFLSHSLLMARLAQDEFMSSAQIARILSAKDSRADFSRQSVETCLAKLRWKHDFTLDDVQHVFQKDHETEEFFFADANLVECTKIINEVGERLGFPGDLSTHLTILCDGDNFGDYTPYIQMLHFQCSIAEKLDHALTDIYEFKPRGEVLNWLIAQYPAALVSAGNPFLNNAKSVESITRSWARSKKAAQFPGACALATVLEGLEAMGFAQKKELSGWIRRWIHRIMRLSEPLNVEVPQFNNDKVSAIILSISLDETGTRGILEQRVSDAFVYLKHATNDGWHCRGLKDSVNASNASRNKLGDCDCQNVATLECVLYEIHAGHLSKPYFDEHIRTFKRALPKRLDEWQTFSASEQWTVTLKFIAHSFAKKLPQEIAAGGLNVALEFQTYEDFFDCNYSEHDMLDAFNEFVFLTLNQKCTPNSVREKCISIIKVE